MKRLRLVFLFSILFSILACEPKTEPKISRWYSQWQLNLGAKVYKVNCVKCHGATGMGTLNRPVNKSTDFYPAPPLNATSDSLQRPLSVLADIVNYGGSKTDGKMPMFRDKLSESEKLAVVAYFQNFWLDDDYKQWLEWGGMD